MINVEINYDKIQKSVNEYGSYILSCIKNQYGNSLTQEQLENINNLLNTQFIIIEKPSNEDIEFFSKQAGIDDPKKYSISYVPSAHGGRTKGDNKIHIYPYTESFNNCKTNDEIIKSCVDSIIVHEIFHYFIRPNLSNTNDTLKAQFGHFLTEGLVQYYTEEFAKKYRLGDPKANYGKNVEFAKKLISSFPNGMSQSQIDKIIFTSNQDELLEISKSGKSLYAEYISDLQFQENLASFIVDIGTEIGIDKDNDRTKRFISYYKKISDLDIIFDELSRNIELIFQDNAELKDSYMKKLRSLISDEKLEKEMPKYEEQINKLRRNGMSLEEIKSTVETNYKLENSNNIEDEKGKSL